MLDVRKLSSSYGPVQALWDVSLQVGEGEAVAMLGPNGAGKSTMFNLITGDVRPDRGRVFLDEHDITDLPASERCRLGIGRSYQVPHPFSGMTVFENVLVGATFGAGLRGEAAHAHCARVDQDVWRHGRLRRLWRCAEHAATWSAAWPAAHWRPLWRGSTRTADNGLRR